MDELNDAIEAAYRAYLARWEQLRDNLEWQEDEELREAYARLGEAIRVRDEALVF